MLSRHKKLRFHRPSWNLPLAEIFMTCLGSRNPNRKTFPPQLMQSRQSPKTQPWASLIYSLLVILSFQGNLDHVICWYGDMILLFIINDLQNHSSNICVWSLLWKWNFSTSTKISEEPLWIVELCSKWYLYFLSSQIHMVHKLKFKKVESFRWSHGFAK